MPGNNQNKGGALLTALFIMTIVAIVATAMSTKVQLDIYRTRLIITHDRLYLASQAVSFWAMGELNDKKNKFLQVKEEGVVSYYPTNMALIDNTVQLSGALYDLQARFNLNNLLNRKYLLGFVKLVRTLTPQSLAAEQIGITFAVYDWLSPYNLARGKDNYLTYYTSNKPPYYPSHQQMISASELRLVKDVSASIYQAVEPYITALPESTPININTAPIQVLKSVSSTKNEGLFNELLMARKENGFKDFTKIAELLKKLNIAKEQITLESTYFLSVANASSDKVNLTVYTLLKRNYDKSKKLSVQILRQSFNVF